jgi:hypothetical protein
LKGIDYQIYRRLPMVGKMVALTAALLLSTQVQAQVSHGTSPGPALGVTSGPAAGTPATMSSPQAGPLATKHQRQVLRKHSQTAGGKQGVGRVSDDGGTTGSSTPPYATPPR